MPKPRSSFTALRRSLLEAADDPPFAARGPVAPFRPLGNADVAARRRRPLADPLALTAPVGPAGSNLAGDVGRVERALGKTGFLDPLDKPDRSRTRPGVFDTRLDQGVRRFQSRNGLKVDGRF